MEKKDILMALACFGCEYNDDCESSWEEGHQHCDSKMNDVLDLIEKIGINLS